jgi:hypothetical protein
LLLLVVTLGLASVVRFRDRNWQHEELFARRATVGEKIGLGLDGMGLAADQAHQRAAALAKQWRQGFFLSDFYLFHDPTLGRAAPPSILFLCNQVLREFQYLRSSVLWNSFINSRVLLLLKH